MIAQNNTTASDIIKQATASAHVTTEKTLMQHIQKIQSAEDYAMLLYCLYGYYAALEPIFNQYMPALLPDYAQRRKAARLVNDITALGFPAPEQRAIEIPAVQQPIEALGCYYVLEGSVLGGAFIKKMMQKQYPVLPDEAFSFFSGYDQQNGAMWKSFLAQFNSLVETEAQKAIAVQAADSCFTLFGKHIVRYYGGKLNAVVSDRL